MEDLTDKKVMIGLSDIIYIEIYTHSNVVDGSVCFEEDDLIRDTNRCRIAADRN